ncbi:MAG: M3 family oligoendopeptidase, partial [Dehalococcoidia bacterium]
MTAATVPLDWDLSDLYLSLADPRLVSDIQELKSAAAAFRARYLGRIAELAADPAAVYGAIETLEALQTLSGRIYAFPRLKFAADTQDSAASAWSDRVAEATTSAQNELVFFALELQSLPEPTFDVLRRSPLLSDCRHFFDRLAEERPHRLSEEVERVLNEQALTGREAFVKLHEVHEGSLKFRPVANPDGGVARTEADLSALLHSADPETRLAAYRSVRAPYRRNNPLFAYILNTIVHDHRQDVRRRGYAGTLQQQLEAADEVPEPVFRALMD